MSLPRGVRFVSIGPGDGYGYSAQGYLGVLERLGVPVRWEPIDLTDDEPTREGTGLSPYARWIDRVIDHDTVIVNLTPDRIPGRVAGESGRLKVAITTDETDRIPAAWVEALSTVDRVVVPSTFNRDVFAASGVTAPIWVVPHVSVLPVSAEPFVHPALDGRFVFYAIGPWTTRKGLAEMVLAFTDAFAATDPVALVVKTGLVDHQAKLRAFHAFRDGRPPVQVATWWTLAQLLADRPQGPEVLLVTDTWDEATMAALHRRGDCLVSLNRGEGFGLTILDAARHAKPVVITGWGGPLDFVDPTYPLLVGHHPIAMADDVPDDWMRTSPDEHWAMADHDDAVDRLRWVFDHQAEAAALGATLAERAEARCGEDAVSAALAAALDH